VQDPGSRRKERKKEKKEIRRADKGKRESRFNHFSERNSSSTEPLAIMAAVRSACQAFLKRKPLSSPRSSISHTRSFLTASASRSPVVGKAVRIQHRALSSSLEARAIVNEAAPVPKAYAEAATVGKNLVDVKKVLVIGSGGLAIGQAGEFDYSGLHTTFTLTTCN